MSPPASAPRPGISARTAIAAIFTLNGVALGTWGARIPAIQDHLDVGPGGLAVALAGLAAGALIAMPAAGRLASRRGSATVVRLAVVALGLSMILPATMPAIGLVAAATFLMGLANGSLDVAMNAQGVEVERAVRRPILSSLHAGFSFGGLIGAGAGALAAAAGVGALPNFLAIGATVAVAGFVRSRSLVADGPAPQSAEETATAATSRGRWYLRGLAFCCLFAEGAALDWSAVHLRDIGATAAVAALAYAAFSVAMASGRMTGDRLSERWGPVALARRGGALATAAMAISLVAGLPAVGLVAYLTLGAGLSVVIPLIFRAAATGADAGPALAGVTTTGYLGLLSGPPLIGAVAALTSVPTALLLVVAATAAVAFGAGALRPPGRTAATAATPLPDTTTTARAA
ncbi:MAG TPA: MFS transporter [Baekduia sp.]|uniref:MFS transporter n=1 Tax=Baekduia sp. TaxID=2600305 RepID=UPI002C44812E|nr:MFS transporter [Baekduia sp.]HMJ35851.1 MFS transporter [Baekduia sp.]